MFVNLSLVNEKVKFLASSSLRPYQEIAFDYVPPIGDGEGYLGLELLVLSFAGCVSTAIIFLLRKMGVTVLSYSMKAVAIRCENPVLLKQINAEIVIASYDLSADAVQQAIQQASLISPVWLAMKDTVDITLTYRAG